MNCIELSQQANSIASSFSKQDLARLVVALKGNRESLQHAVEVIDTVDSRSGCTLEEAWDEVLAGDSQLRIEDEALRHFMWIWPDRTGGPPGCQSGRSWR